MTFRSSKEAPPDSLAPVIDFDSFMTYIMDSNDPQVRYAQNHHMGLIGPTESGKSTLLHAVLPLRDYVTFFGTKVKDDTLEKFASKGGYERIGDWPPTKGKFRKKVLTAKEMPKRLLWPDVSSLDQVMELRPVFDRAVSGIYGDGGWTVVWDEFWLQCDILKMRQTAKVLLQQARSNDISMVMGMQRPAWIPPEVYDQTRHLFFWRDADELNLKRIGSIGWLNADPIKGFVARLEPFQFLYVNNRTGQMFRSTAPQL